MDDDRKLTLFTPEVPSEQSPNAPNSVFRTLRDAARSNTASKMFPVGTILPDTWQDVTAGQTYDAPWRVVDYRKVLTADKSERLVAILLREFVSATRQVFDQASSLYLVAQISQYMEVEYAQGCSPELLKAVTPHQITVDDQTMLATFFLPAPEELGIIIPSLNGHLRDQKWEYFRKLPEGRFAECKRRAFQDCNGQSRLVWTRSHNGSGHVYYLNSNGCLYHRDSSSECGILATCAVG